MLSINLILLIMCLGEIQAYTTQNDSELTNNRLLGDHRKCSGTDHNFMVAILFIEGKRFNCGGALISSRWVVTSRQCMHDWTKLQFYMVVAGVESPLEKYWGKDMQSSVVKRCYPGFDKVQDIGLMHLEKSIKTSRVVSYIEVASHVDLINKELQHVCSNATIMGWGTKNVMKYEKLAPDEKIEPNEPYLKCFNAPVISQYACDKRLEALGVLRNLSSWNGCIFKKNLDVCVGDSGSALVCNDLLVGTVAPGYGCSCKEYPAVYTMLYNYRFFLMSTQTNVEAEAAQSQKCSAVQHSFSVAIIHQETMKNYDYICAGSLVTDTLVLTSGFCTIKCHTPSYYTVVAGLQNFVLFDPKDKDTLWSQVTKCYQYPTRNELGGIALMKLKNGIPEGEKVSYVRFATLSDIKNKNFEKACSKGMLIGYGRSKKSLYNNQQCVETTATSDKQCKKKLSSANLRDDHGCIDGLKSDYCYTTLGTPLVCNGIQYGVLSSADCSERKKPNSHSYVIAKVHKYHDFLQKMVHINDKTALSKANWNTKNPVNLYIFIFYFILYVI